MAPTAGRVTARFVPTLTQTVDAQRVLAAQRSAAPAAVPGTPAAGAAPTTPGAAPALAPAHALGSAPAPSFQAQVAPTQRSAPPTQAPDTQALAQAVWQHVQPRIEAAIAQSSARLLQRLQAVEIEPWAAQTRADLQALTLQAVQAALAAPLTPDVLDLPHAPPPAARP